MSLSKKYTKSLDQRWSMRFTTKLPDAETFDGIVTHIKSSFIVLQQVSNFEIDGTLILPKRIITGTRDGELERCANEILRENGEINQVAAPAWLSDCKTIHDVLTQLKERDQWPTITTLHQDETVMYIGPIVSVATNNTALFCYGASGEWECEYELSFKSIVSIEFDDTYSQHFNPHMRNKPRPTP